MSKPEEGLRIGRVETVYATPFFDLVAKTVTGADPGSPYYTVNTLDYVCLIAFTAAEEILLVRQYRPSVEAYTVELPSGHVEEGETPEEAALKELAEETGHRAERVTPLGSLIPDSGRLGNRMWCFFAEGATPCVETGTPEAGLERVTLGANEWHELVQAGKFQHALHFAALYLAEGKGLMPPAFSLIRSQA